MPAFNYLFAKVEGIEFQGKNDRLSIPFSVMKEALITTNKKLKYLDEQVEGLFEILGMRNLSAFVGEVFVREMVKASGGAFIKNPHQDGYPDLLVMTEEGKTHFKTLENEMRSKAPFSDFATGGIEVKATCGSVPTPAVCQKRGIVKPDMGDPRIDVMTGYDWKAHHRLTNNLAGIVWDFVDRIPTIVGLFYCSNLTQDDWGDIVHPKEGGGRTTSVSIMNRGGIAKMYKGWLAVVDDDRYLRFFDRFNSDQLLQRAKEDRAGDD